MAGLITGGCGCGAVRFEIDRPLLSASYCHCTRCQHRTGSGAAATARAESRSVRVVEGADALRGWAPEGGREKVFCVQCGSALFSCEPGTQDYTGVRLAAIEVTPLVEQVGAEARALDRLQELLGDDRVGVDVGTIERCDQPFLAYEFFHVSAWTSESPRQPSPRPCRCRARCCTLRAQRTRPRASTLRIAS